jgi:hypothetical protein
VRHVPNIARPDRTIHVELTPPRDQPMWVGIDCGVDPNERDPNIVFIEPR